MSKYISQLMIYYELERHDRSTTAELAERIYGADYQPKQRRNVYRCMKRLESKGMVRQINYLPKSGIVWEVA